MTESGKIIPFDKHRRREHWTESERHTAECLEKEIQRIEIELKDSFKKTGASKLEIHRHAVRGEEPFIEAIYDYVVKTPKDEDILRDAVLDAVEIMQRFTKIKFQIVPICMHER